MDIPGFLDLVGTLSALSAHTLDSVDGWAPMLPMRQSSKLFLSYSHAGAFSADNFGLCRHLELSFFFTLAELHLSSVRMDCISVRQCHRLTKVVVNASLLRMEDCTAVERIVLTDSFSDIFVRNLSSLTTIRFNGAAADAKVALSFVPSLRIFQADVESGIIFNRFELYDNASNFDASRLMVDPAFFARSDQPESWFGLLNVASPQACALVMQRRICMMRILILIVASRRRRIRHPPPEIWCLVIDEFIV